MTPRADRWAPWLNLLLPGGGLILCGYATQGLVGGLVFAACANFALAAVLLFPDDFAAPVRAAAIALAACGYVGLQWGQLRAEYARQRRDAAERRARTLRAVQKFLAAGDSGSARSALESLAQEWPDDLHVAYRLAEVLSAAGDVVAARAAWRHLRTLDRDGIYRSQWRAAERVLGGKRSE